MTIPSATPSSMASTWGVRIAAFITVLIWPDMAWWRPTDDDNPAAAPPTNCIRMVSRKTPVSSVA